MKVETHIKVVMEMTLEEARELAESLESAPGSFNHWQALTAALAQVENVKAES